MMVKVVAVEPSSYMLSSCFLLSFTFIPYMHAFSFPNYLFIMHRPFVIRNKGCHRLAIDSLPRVHQLNETD